MEIFDDEIGSLTQDIHLKAYKNLVRSYRTALTVVWDLAQFADISLILEMVHDKEMLELAMMAQKLDLPPPSTQVVKEKKKRPNIGDDNWCDDSLVSRPGRIKCRHV